MKILSFLEKLYPREPFQISFSRGKILFLLILAILEGGDFYLRTQKQDELDLLRQQFEKIRVMVRNYMRCMSNADTNLLTSSEISNRLEKFKKNFS